MTNQQILRMAVIGAGAMGRNHAKTIREQVPEMELIAVVDAHAPTAQAAATELGVPAFTSVAELLNSSARPDAALVATPHPLHAAAAVPCLEAGLHVLCEKPLAESVTAADCMLAAAKAKDLTLGIMFQQRFNPAFEAALEFARAGRLGRIRRALLVVPDFRTQYYFESNPWRATWKGEGGGVLINQAPHLIDIFLQLTGLPESLRGQTGTRLHKIEVEDVAEAMLRFPGGGSGFVYCSTNEPADGEMLEIVGDAGQILYRAGRLECAVFKRGLGDLASNSQEVWGRPEAVPATPEIIEHPNGTFSVLRNFARHILFKETLTCSAVTGLYALELANAITLSSHTGREVSFPVPRDEYEALLNHLRDNATGAKRVRQHERVTDPRVK